MLTGELRNQIDQIWNAFWSGGIANPLEVIEQITCLLFIKRLDEIRRSIGFLRRADLFSSRV
jgi:type I restriction enzyme M protein